MNKIKPDFISRTRQLNCSKLTHTRKVSMLKKRTRKPRKS